MKLFNWLGKALEESPGVPSSIRLQMFIICLMSSVLPLGVWAALSIHDKKMVEIPSTITTFCALLVSAATAGKVIQHQSEPTNKE